MQQPAYINTQEEGEEGYIQIMTFFITKVNCINTNSTYLGDCSEKSCGKRRSRRDSWFFLSVVAATNLCLFGVGPVWRHQKPIQRDWLDVGDCNTSQETTCWESFAKTETAQLEKLHKPPWATTGRWGQQWANSNEPCVDVGGKLPIWTEYAKIMNVSVCFSWNTRVFTTVTRQLHKNASVGTRSSTTINRTVKSSTKFNSC